MSNPQLTPCPRFAFVPASQVEDQSQQAQMATAQQLAAASGLGEEEDGDECVPTRLSASPAVALALTPSPPLRPSLRIPELQNLVTDKTPKSAPQASDAEIDEKDVEILMAQASCDHDKAVRLLKEANGDLINASASLRPPPLCAGGPF